jgi:predicted RNA polymerase sigma factor
MRAHDGTARSGRKTDMTRLLLAAALAAPGRGDEAQDAYARAIGLSADPAVRARLTAQRGAIS